jgi:hypothetical protein
MAYSRWGNAWAPGSWGSSWGAVASEPGTPQEYDLLISDVYIPVVYDSFGISTQVIFRPPDAIIPVVEDRVALQSEATLLPNGFYIPTSNDIATFLSLASFFASPFGMRSFYERPPISQDHVLSGAEEASVVAFDPVAISSLATLLNSDVSLEIIYDTPNAIIGADLVTADGIVLASVVDPVLITQAHNLNVEEYFASFVYGDIVFSRRGGEELVKRAATVGRRSLTAPGVAQSVTMQGGVRRTAIRAPSSSQNVAVNTSVGKRSETATTIHEEGST